jgi:two-component system response regulator AtoC
VEDLPALVQHFVLRCNERLGKSVRGFAEPALELLSRYAWPGNIRELENLVERMVLFASTPVIEAQALPDAFHEIAAGADHGAHGVPLSEVTTHAALGGSATVEGAAERLLRLPLASLGLDLKEAVRAGSRLVEEALITEALEQTQGNVTRSARLLGISRRSLQSKMKELGLRTLPDGHGPV